MDFDRFFSERHTVRAFSGRPVSDELLEKIVEEAAHAPNTGNMQLYSVVATRSDEIKAELAPQHFNQPCASGCSVMLTFCVDIHRFRRWCEERGADCGFDNTQMFMAAAIDAALFAGQLNTIAELHGLGGCFLGTTLYNAPAIAEILRLPAGVVPLVALALGYPAAEGQPSERLPLRAILHHERYNDFSGADIDAVYAAQEAAPEAAKFMAENDKDSLAAVFSEVRYPRASNESFSRALDAWLAPQFPRGC